jgi:cellulose synthase/poly-beta-1,6-N-acetylglucosamine synthase-like glycosyltransferase
VPPSALEIVVSDFGSDAEQARNIRELAASHGARVVRCETNEIWNRSRAMNVAVRAARGQFVLCTDADMIFEPNYVATALELLREDDQRMIVCRCLDLPSSVPEQPWTCADYPRLRAQAKYRRTNGTGACQAARRDWFEAVRGYDETFVYWGFEDNDMLSRAEVSGLRVTWMHERTSMLHQWHPTTRNSRPVLKYRNKFHYWLTRRTVRKNPVSWGEARPA